MEKASIVKQSSRIKECLKKRFAELDLSHLQITEDSKKYGHFGISASTLSRYFNGIAKNALTEEAIIFLCYRWGIPVVLLVGCPIIKENKLSTIIPKYDERACIERVKDIFRMVKKSEATDMVSKDSD